MRLFLLFLLFSLDMTYRAYSSSIQRNQEERIRQILMKESIKLIDTTEHTIIDKSKLKGNEIFWNYKFSRENPRYSKISEFESPTYPKQIDNITIKGEVVSDIYSPSDYPFFNPIIFFSKDLSLGERERIKKSLIIVKIIVHSDMFLDLMETQKNIFSIKNYFSDYIDDPQEKEKSIPYDSLKKIYEYILYEKTYIYMEKLNFDTFSSQTIADAIAFKFNNNVKVGIIRFHNGGKILNSFSYSLPMILFHEYFHVLGYRHASKKNINHNPIIMDARKDQKDISYQFGTSIFYKLYDNFKLPKIDDSCYRGFEEDWNLC